jgi:hypothetical protein
MRIRSHRIGCTDYNFVLQMDRGEVVLVRWMSSNAISTARQAVLSQRDPLPLVGPATSVSDHHDGLSPSASLGDDSGGVGGYQGQTSRSSFVGPDCSFGPVFLRSVVPRPYLGRIASLGNRQRMRQRSVTSMNPAVSHRSHKHEDESPSCPGLFRKVPT